MKNELVSLIFLVCCSLIIPGRVLSKPNIVIIVADDLGWADVSYHGSQLLTPNIDMLGNSSVRLERFYTHVACTPTRTAIMSGIYPHKLGLADYVIKPWDTISFPLDRKTLADTLKGAGYYTAIIGKWHLGHARAKFLPNNRGFDYHYGFYTGRISYFNHSLFKERDWHRNSRNVYEKGYSTTLLGNDAVNLIEAHNYSAKPLFLYIAFNAPHLPLEAKPEDYDKFLYLKDHKRRLYAAQVYDLDRQVGRVVKALKGTGQWQNTLFLFFSDNGGYMSETNGRGDNRPLRGHKGELYDGGVRVPAIVSYPPRISKIKISNHYFHVVDVHRTAIDLAGASYNYQVDGINIVDSLKGPSERTMLIHLDSVSGALIRSYYKIVKNGKRRNPPLFYPKYELFYLPNDPYEKIDLSENMPILFDNMKVLLEAEGKIAVSPLVHMPKDKSSNVPTDFVPLKDWTPTR